MYIFISNPEKLMAIENYVPNDIKQKREEILDTLDIFLEAVKFKELPEARGYAFELCEKCESDYSIIPSMGLYELRLYILNMVDEWEAQLLASAKEQGYKFSWYEFYEEFIVGIEKLGVESARERYCIVTSAFRMLKEYEMDDTLRTFIEWVACDAIACDSPARYNITPKALSHITFSGDRKTYENVDSFVMSEEAFQEIGALYDVESIREQVKALSLEHKRLIDFGKKPGVQSCIKEFSELVTKFSKLVMVQ